MHLNGKETEVADGLTVSALLAAKGLDPKKVVVERNREILDKNSWAQVVLNADDKLEIITVVGGG